MEFPSSEMQMTKTVFVLLATSVVTMAAQLEAQNPPSVSEQIAAATLAP